MKMNKEQFLKTEFGGELESTITAWDDALSRNREDKEVLRTLAWCQAQWEVYRMAIKHFYGVEYHFTRTDEYYGLCTEDESDWLMRVKRVKLFQMKTVFSRQRVTRRGIRIKAVSYFYLCTSRIREKKRKHDMVAQGALQKEKAPYSCTLWL